MTHFKVLLIISFLLTVFVSKSNAMVKAKSHFKLYKNAIENGSEEAVRQLITQRVSVNCVSKKGKRPLHLAAELGMLAIARLLLEKGADVNALTSKRKTALHSVAAGGQIAMAELLLQYQANGKIADNDGKWPVHIAKDMGNVEMEGFLMKAGTKEKIERSYDGGKSEITAAQLEKKMREISKQKKEKQKLKSDTAHLSQYPVYASHTSHHDNNAYNTISEEKSQETLDSELHYAIIDGSKAEAERLIKKGARVSGHSLYNPVETNDEGLIRFLLDKGASANYRADGNESVLMRACTLGHAAAASLLIRYGADVNEKKDGYDSPLKAARRNHHNHIVKILLDAGAVDETATRRASYQRAVQQQSNNSNNRNYTEQSYRNRSHTVPAATTINDGARTVNTIVKTVGNIMDVVNQGMQMSQGNADPSQYYPQQAQFYSPGWYNGFYYPNGFYQ